MNRNMFTEESYATKKRRLIYKGFLQVILGLFTCIIWSLDSYVIFSSSLAQANNLADNQTIFYGPLFTMICPGINQTIPNKCPKILFYNRSDTLDQLSLHSNLLISIWLPIIFGIIITRITFWKIHPVIQSVISFGYLGFLWILVTSEYYSLGSSVIIVLCRISVSCIFSALIIILMVARHIRTKYFPKASDINTLVGFSAMREEPVFDDSDNSIDDPASEEYYATRRYPVSAD